MEILTWAEYKARSTDKGGFVLTHYSKLFNAAHCRVNIKGLDFQLGYDDRFYNEKEWNNQVNQFKDSHLADFVEITAEVVREIKATLVNYEAELIEVNAMLATGLSGTDYNGAKSSQQHLEMMVNKYKRIIELLPSFEDVLLVEGSNEIKSNKTNQYQGKTNMKTRMIEVNAEFVIAALESRYEDVKELWGCQASHDLWEQALSLVEDAGLGNCSSPSVYVDNYLINGEFVSKYDACQNGYISKDECEYDEYDEQWIVTDEAWNEYCEDNALIYNGEYACLRF